MVGYIARCGVNGCTINRTFPEMVGSHPRMRTLEVAHNVCMWGREGGADGVRRGVGRSVRSHPRVVIDGAR